MSHSMIMAGQDIRRRILVVDDDLFNLISLKIILEQADRSGMIKDFIDEATNGQDALKAVKKAHHDGVF